MVYPIIDSYLFSSALQLLMPFVIYFVQFKHTPLHWAVEEDYPNLVKLLLKYGADPYAESKAKQTPMSIAGEMGFDDMMQMMSTYKYQSSVSMEEQQEATDALMHEMGTEHLDAFKHNDADLSQDSTSCEDSSSASINLQANLNNSHKQSHRNCKQKMCICI